MFMKRTSSFHAGRVIFLVKSREFGQTTGGIGTGPAQGPAPTEELVQMVAGVQTF